MALKEKEVDFCDLWHPTDRQKEAGEAVQHHKYVLYGGAMGGGKSYFLRWQLIYLLMYYAKQYNLRGVRVGLFCENYPALKDRQISKIEQEFPEWLGRLNKAEHDFVLAPNFGGGSLCFRNLDDTSKYKSAEFASIAIDELTQNQKEVFDLLRTRLRWPGISDVKFMAGTNPGGVGHNWVKALWLDKVYEPTEQEQEEFHFVPAKATDNPHLEQSYFTALEGLPEKLRQAYVEGNWDRFEGQFFDDWNREIHIVPMPIGLQNEFISIDYGYAKPSSVGWYKIGIDGKLVRYKELYVEKMTYSALGKAIMAMTDEPKKVEYAVGDPAMWGDRAHHKDSLVGESGAEILQEEVEPILLMRGDNVRNIGWGRCREYLKPYVDQHGQKTAKFGVAKNCTNFIRTVPAMVHSLSRPEDLNTDGEDHPSDEWRYACMSRPEKPTKSKEVHVLTHDEVVWKKAKEQVQRKIKARKHEESELVGMRG